MQFPSLMFVQRIPYKSVQRRRIHNWLLLMVRLAALALIVLAFARPFFERRDPAAGGHRRPRGRGPARPELQHRLRRSLGARARGGVRRGQRPRRRPTAARWCCSRRAPRSSLRPLGASSATALTAAVAAAKPGDGRHPLRAGAEGGRQHPRRVAAAAARSGADQRLPAQRVARRGRRAAAAGHAVTPVAIGGAPISRMSP